MDTNTINQSNCKYKLGLALSGGGARGLAHIGVLNAFRKNDLTPDLIAGASAGALIGALFCAGYEPDEIKKLFKGEHFGRFARLTMPRECLLNSNGLKDFLVKHLAERTFDDLAIPMRVIATDIEHCRSVTISQGNVAKAVWASCSIPVLFPPVEIDGISYVDGGVLRNLPVLPIRDECEYVVAVDVNPLKPGKFKRNLLAIAERSYSMLFRANANEDKKMCDLLIEAGNVSDYSIFDIQHLQEIVGCGYKSAMSSLKNAPIKHL